MNEEKVTKIADRLSRIFIKGPSSRTNSLTLPTKYSGLVKLSRQPAYFLKKIDFEWSCYVMMILDMTGLSEVRRIIK